MENLETTTMKELTLTISMVDLKILLRKMKANQNNEICDTAIIGIKYDAESKSYKWSRNRFINK